MKLNDLAISCGVSPRTVRYYVQRGLLPAPVFKGRDTAYDDEHRFRLLAIKRMQDRFLPLDAIEAELKRRSPEQIRAIAEGAPFDTDAVAQESVETQPVTPIVPRTQVHPFIPAVSIPWSHPTRRTSFERIELEPGLELQISSDAPAEVRGRAEELVRLARQLQGGRR